MDIVRRFVVPCRIAIRAPDGIISPPLIRGGSPHLCRAAGRDTETNFDDSSVLLIHMDALWVHEREGFEAPSSHAGSVIFSGTLMRRSGQYRQTVCGIDLRALQLRTPRRGSHDRTDDCLG